jgi:hypothetical protein
MIGMGYGSLDRVCALTPDQTELLVDSAARRRSRELLDRLTVTHPEKPKRLGQQLQAEARRRRRRGKREDVSGGIRLDELVAAMGGNIKDAPATPRDTSKIVDVTAWRERVERERAEKMRIITGG